VAACPGVASLLDDLIDPEAIGVAGHFTRRSPWPGSSSPFTGGTFFTGNTASPLPRNVRPHGPYGAGQTLCADGRSSTFFLTRDGAPHTTFFDRWGPAMTTAVLAFFDRSFKQQLELPSDPGIRHRPCVASIQFRLDRRRRDAAT
jgi:hypothetical protein